MTIIGVVLLLAGAGIAALVFMGAAPGFITSVCPYPCSAG